MKKDSKGKNQVVEVFRFLATVAMLLHHTDSLGINRIAWGGWIFVEFFFILSGYLMTSHFENHFDEEIQYPAKIAFQYTFKKLRRIIPYAYVGICIGAFTHIALNRYSVQAIKNAIFNLPANFLLLGGSGLCNYTYDSPLWYLTGIMIAMPVLVFVMLKHHSFYKYIGSWITPIALYMVMFSWHGNIQYWDINWNYQCMIRAFAGLMMGSAAYYLSDYLRAVTISGIMRLIFTVAEVFLFGFVFIRSIHDELMSISFLCVLLFVTVICISFSEKEMLKKYLPSQTGKIGRITMPLFCLHKPIYEWIKCYGIKIPLSSRLWIGLGFSFGTSIFLILLFDTIDIAIQKKNGYAVKRKS